MYICIYIYIGTYIHVYIYIYITYMYIHPVYSHHLPALIILNIDIGGEAYGSICFLSARFHAWASHFKTTNRTAAAQATCLFCNLPVSVVMLPVRMLAKQGHKPHDELVGYIPVSLFQISNQC